MQKFEEGMKISKECSEMLENAEKKITMLIKGENGELAEEKICAKRGNRKMMGIISEYKYLIVPFATWFFIQLFKLIYDLLQQRNLTLKEY